MFENIVITPQLFATLAGAFISLIFSYVPSLNTWFARKSADFQRLTMVGLMVLVAIFLYLAGCLGWITIENFVCGQQSIMTFLSALIMALIANQGTYAVSPQTPQVKQLKAQN